MADTLVEEAGIRGMLHRTPAAPIMDGDGSPIITESNAGRGFIRWRGSSMQRATPISLRGAPTFHTPKEEMMAVPVTFHPAGVDKKRIASRPTCRATRMGRGGEEHETGGKEDTCSHCSEASVRTGDQDGLLPPTLTTLAGTGVHPRHR